MRFLFGIFVGICLWVIAGFVYLRSGGVSVATRGRPLPFEAKIAHMARRAAIGKAAKVPSPLPASEENLAAGAKIYVENCAVCHGVPGRGPTAIARGMYPRPPQLFEPKEMVTDDPIGSTFWKVKNGIRLTGMPGFADALKDEQIWQVSLLLSHADKLPPRAEQALTKF